MRKRLTAIARATTDVDSRRRKALVADLQAQHQAITGAIAAADPIQALQLLVRFLELAELIGANGYGQFDELIPSVAPALGEAGLAALQIAEARGDVDAYMAQFDARQLSRPALAADVARHLLEAGRADQALAVLDGAAANLTEWQADARSDARIAVLEALGQRGEAQQQRWASFCRCLSISHLRAFLQRLDDFADVEAEERALQLAEQHPQPLLALVFLVQWPALPRAARHVIRHSGQWDREAFEICAPAAECLSPDHPRAASILLRAMVEFALSSGRSRR